MATDDDAERLIRAISDGEPVLLPTDTVYGLCASADSAAATLRAYAVKGRDQAQPSALLTASIDELLDRMPELRGRDERIVRALLPGPYTLVLPNPARRFRWLTGTRPDTIGIRVVDLPAAAQQVLDAVGAVMATSANDPGGPNPATLDDVPEALRAACAAELDAGPLPGLPSTVLDFTGLEPVVVREGAASAQGALERVSAALGA